MTCVTSSEIQWTPEAVARLECLPPSDLADLEPWDLLDYTLDLQQELTAVRMVWHDAVHLFVHHTRLLDKLRQQHWALLDAHRALYNQHQQLRDEHRALRDQVRA